jgi:hypothetical protein
MIGESMTNALESDSNVNDLPILLRLAMGGVALGGTVGIAESLVLLRYLKWKGSVEWYLPTMLGRIGRWFFLTTIGVAVWALFSTGFQTENTYAFNYASKVYELGVLTWHRDYSALFSNCFLWLPLITLIYGISGGITGLAQWLVLRRRVLHAEWWILANVGGAIFAIVAVAILTFLNAFVDNPGIYSILFGAIYASTTGVAIVELLRHPKPEAEWQLATRPEPMLEPTSDTVLGSMLYEQGPAVQHSSQHTETNTHQGDHNT